MADYPYTLKVSSLKAFLETIHDRKIPDKVTIKYITQCGYKSKRDRPIIKILKFINFIDEKGVPTKNFKDMLTSKEVSWLLEG